MAVNLFEIDYLQLCFSDLGSNYIKQSEMTDIILYQNEIQVDKLRFNYHQRHLEKEWDSFKIVNPTVATEVFNTCLKLNFALTNKIKVLCKLKPQGKMIIRCTASISQIVPSSPVSFEINILNQTY
ncbi:hypothetical protein M1771_05810 [Spiroplasma citri]|uniref:Uncharacterized protein n=1 Tax=Spiroplasma citri TaxID=2133 RepID=A0AAX3SWI4_SPICI|nr:hypothetical protein [Spiroplasma citri]WFG95620.1 hypothetical protein M0C40_05850 [Spiroplasma citri]WFG99507.1 hypothetical protein M1771_05810 [Spiroplasma citri]